MTSDEADRFISRCRRVLPRWQREIETSQGDGRAEALAVRDSVLGTLMEIGDDFPEKREAVDLIARDYRYGTWHAD